MSSPTILPGPLLLIMRGMIAHHKATEEVGAKYEPVARKVMEVVAKFLQPGLIVVAMQGDLMGYAARPEHQHLLEEDNPPLWYVVAATISDFHHGTPDRAEEYEDEGKAVESSIHAYLTSFPDDALMIVANDDVDKPMLTYARGVPA